MNCLVRFGNCFLRVALMYQPSCLLPCCQGKPGELAKKLLSKPQKQFILSLGTFIPFCIAKSFEVDEKSPLYIVKKFVSQIAWQYIMMAQVPPVTRSL